MDLSKKIKEYNIKPKKYMDQIFLQDNNYLEKLIVAANLNEDDIVLEVGPGLGNITEAIAKRCNVIAIEKDKKFANIIKKLDIPRTEIIENDALDVDYTKIKFNKIIANPPFSISTPLTFKLIELDWELAVLIYQKEFAERMITKPGNSNYSRFSLAVNYYCDVELVDIIPKKSFYPVPETDSAIVKLVKKDVPEKSVLFWKVVKASFQHKRKKLKNSLKDSCHFLGIEEEKINKNIDVIPDKRVTECDISDFEKVMRIISD